MEYDLRKQVAPRKSPWNMNTTSVSFCRNLAPISTSGSLWSEINFYCLSHRVRLYSPPKDRLMIYAD